jgi:hypothetical protein
MVACRGGNGRQQRRRLDQALRLRVDAAGSCANHQFRQLCANPAVRATANAWYPAVFAVPACHAVRINAT